MNIKKEYSKQKRESKEKRKTVDAIVSTKLFF